MNLCNMDMYVDSQSKFQSTAVSIDKMLAIEYLVLKRSVTLNVESSSIDSGRAYSGVIY